MASKIAIIRGDGIGPEVIEQDVKVLNKISDLYNIGLYYDFIEAGGKYFLETGKEWQPDALKKCKQADAILKGPVGYIDPKTGKEVRREDGRLAGHIAVVGLRQELELFANVRPIKVYKGVRFKVSQEYYPDIYTSKNVDMVFVRENTEGLYANREPRIKKTAIRRIIKEVVSDCVISKKATERIVKYAFDMAKKMKGRPLDGKKIVTCIDKSNATISHRFFRDVFNRVASKYKDVEHNHEYADSFAGLLLLQPEYYNILVGPNMVMDILSDEAANLQGGRGVAPSANIGYNHAAFEAIHGSAPKMAGLDIANPIAIVRSSAMMLDWLSEKKNDKNLHLAAELIERAVGELIREGTYLTQDMGGESKCSQIGSALLRKIEELY